MAIVGIPKNEVFQLGQFKAQLLAVETTGTGDHTITNAVLASYKGPEFKFSAVRGLLKQGSQNSKIHYTLTSNGRLSTIVLNSSATALHSILIIGE